MFGCGLWEQVVKENRGPDRIPIIVEKCIAYVFVSCLVAAIMFTMVRHSFLTERGLKEPGIFRLPGRTSRVEALRESFNKGMILWTLSHGLQHLNICGDAHPCRRRP